MIEKNPRFPEKTNVEFVEVISNKELKMKVWERGAGVTLACGTGACAALVAAHLNQKAGEKAVVHLDGGDLFIEWDRKTNHVYKTGPAHMVFTGTIEI
jgi:diaminopimelate epimerase